MPVRVFIIIALCFLTESVVYAQGLNKVERNILEIKRLGTRISAIEIEMKLPLASNPGHRKWKYPSQKAIKGLDKIKKDLDQLRTVPEVKDLRIKLHDTIDGL
ncbi:MAG: hypothetical protein HY591_02930, partial [Candidatus Omnitrophica bacterium]|nr:hypothetical protein [Candidatus Omnitrophota bacterium]